MRVFVSVSRGVHIRANIRCSTGTIDARRRTNRYRIEDAKALLQMNKDDFIRVTQVDPE